MSEPKAMAGGAVNLRKSIVETFWRERDPRIARILGWMESVEDWMVDDHESVAGALGQLTQRIGQSNGRILAARADAMIDILAYMSSSRAMRLLEWLDDRFHNELAIQLVERAGRRDEDPRAMLLIDRLQTLRGLSLLGRVFSPSRCRLITGLLRELEHGESELTESGRIGDEESTDGGDSTAGERR